MCSKDTPDYDIFEFYFALPAHVSAKADSRFVCLYFVSLLCRWLDYLHSYLLLQLHPGVQHTMIEKPHLLTQELPFSLVRMHSAVGFTRVASWGVVC